MTTATFSPWRDASATSCRTCTHAIGRADGVHIWCTRHRLVTVFPCGWWQREPGTDLDDGATAREVLVRPLVRGI